MSQEQARTPLRFRWSHLHPAHRTTVKAINRGLARLPLAHKYAITSRLRASTPPYDFVGPGDIVVQVGAPSDTLHSGRSRGMHLALRARGGRAIIVEPDPASAEEFRSAAVRLGLSHVTVVNSGAWFEPGSLRLLVDPTHPATNFVDGQVSYDDERRRDYVPVEVPVKTLDQIVEEVLGDIPPIRLLSVTTNNSERQILQGIPRIVSNGLQYLCLARTGEGYEAISDNLGFDFLCVDDRGYTYVRRSTQAP